MSLEDFIRSHRSEFDDLKAPRSVWQKIDSPRRTVHPLWKGLAIAASVLLLLSVGYIIGSHGRPNLQLVESKEYQETEKYYESRIQLKMDQIKTLPVSDEVIADIQMLDDVYQQLRTQLMEDPNSNAQILLTAMIRHQQQKLEIMEKILNSVDKYKTNDKETLEL
jgi:hypothetical protein